MSTERTESQSSDEMQERMVRVGILLVDCQTGLAKRIDNTQTFNLSKNQITLLQIMDGDNWVSASEIAFQLEIAKESNRAMSLATSQNGHAKEALKILDDLDSVYGEIHSPLSTSVETIRESVWILRNQIGHDLIDTRINFGYRLRSEENL